MKQQTFASVAWTQKGKVTRRERFLGGHGDPVGPVDGAGGDPLARHREEPGPAHAMFAFANLYALRHRSMPARARCAL